jgi:DNA polymerase-1
MQIHDELSWSFCLDDGIETLFEFKRIMEDWEDGQVPIVADMELTTTTWADKKEVSSIDEIKQFLQYNAVTRV